MKVIRGGGTDLRISSSCCDKKKNYERPADLRMSKAYNNQTANKLSKNHSQLTKILKE